MRLTDNEVTAIKECTCRFFGEGGQVYLFGSRTDDTKRGGDIDLFVEADGTEEELMRRKLLALSAIQLRLGERKIDLITHARGNQHPPVIVQEARETGVLL